MLGAYEQARDHAAKSLLISHEQGNKVGEANTLTVYATSLNELGQTEEAEKQYRKAIRAQKEMNMNWSLSFSLLEWGAFQLSAGWLEEAEKTFNEALVINRDMRYLYMTTQSDLAMVYLAQDKQQQALTFADEIWKSIAPTQGKGLPFPIKTLFECYSIFHACGDARAKEALSQPQRYSSNLQPESMILNCESHSCIMCQSTGPCNRHCKTHWVNNTACYTNASPKFVEAFD